MRWVLFIVIMGLGCGGRVIDEPECSEAADCYDGDSCTVDRCREDGTCDNSRYGGECSE